jgi:hypothetical protein
MSNTEASVELHPPDDAVTAELRHGLFVWTVSYRPNGPAEQIDSESLRSDLGNDLAVDRVISFLEGRLMAAGRAILHCRVGEARRDSVAVIWTLALPAPKKQ